MKGSWCLVSLDFMFSPRATLSESCSTVHRQTHFNNTWCLLGGLLYVVSCHLANMPVDPPGKEWVKIRCPTSRVFVNNRASVNDWRPVECSTLKPKGKTLNSTLLRLVSHHQDFRCCQRTKNYCTSSRSIYYALSS